MRLFDLHADTLTVCCDRGGSLRKNDCHIDFCRAVTLFEYWRQVMAVYIPDAMDESSVWQYAKRCIAYLQDELRASPDDICFVQNGDDIALDNRFAVLLGIENGKVIGDDLDRLCQLAAMGVVYVTVTWNGSNRLGHGCMTGETTGLTAFGKSAVNKMFEYGIVPDVSHLNDSGFWDVAEIANGRPFIASHSVSKAVHPHSRNLTDEQFAAIRDVGGLVGLNLCASQLGSQTFDCFERHVDRFLSLDGEQTLAIGMDLDGTDIPAHWNGIQCAELLYEHLLKKNYSSVLLSRIFFENSQAFFMKTLTSRGECIRIGR